MAENGSNAVHCKYGICIPNDYNNVEMPTNKPVHVSLGIMELDIRAVNDKGYYITLDITLAMEWQDNRITLQENTTGFNVIGTDFTEKLWEPDIYIEQLKKGKTNRLFRDFRGKLIGF